MTRTARQRLRSEFRERRIEVELLADPARTNAEIARALDVRSRAVRRERKRLEALGVLEATAEGGTGVSVLDELRLSEADLGALARDEPERSGLRERASRLPPAGAAPEVPPGEGGRETAGGQVVCPACGFAQTATSSSCRACGNRLRPTPNLAARWAVIGP